MNYDCKRYAADSATTHHQRVIAGDASIPLLRRFIGDYIAFMKQLRHSVDYYY